MTTEAGRPPARADVLALVLELTAEAIVDDDVDKSQLSDATALLGDGAVVDSLGLVRIIADVEEAMSDQYGYSLNLTDERALSQEKSPFRSVGSLVDHVIASAGASRQP